MLLVKFACSKSTGHQVEAFWTQGWNLSYIKHLEEPTKNHQFITIIIPLVNTHNCQNNWTFPTMQWLQFLAPGVGSRWCFQSKKKWETCAQHVRNEAPACGYWAASMTEKKASAAFPTQWPVLEIATTRDCEVTWQVECGCTVSIPLTFVAHHTVRKFRCKKFPVLHKDISIPTDHGKITAA